MKSIKTVPIQPLLLFFAFVSCSNAFFLSPPIQRFRLPPQKLSHNPHYTVSAQPQKPEKPEFAPKPMQVWCYQRRPREVPHYVHFDALLLMETSLQNVFGRIGKPVYSVEVCPGQKHFRLLRDNRMTGFMINVTEQRGQQVAAAAIGSARWLVAYVEQYTDNMNNPNPQLNNSPDDVAASKRPTNSNRWRMIPAENLIGASASSPTQIAFVVERVEDVMGFAKSLEIGVDALVVRDDAPPELWEAVLAAKEMRRREIMQYVAGKPQAQAPPPPPPPPQQAFVRPPPPPPKQKQQAEQESVSDKKKAKKSDTPKGDFHVPPLEEDPVDDDCPIAEEHLDEPTNGSADEHVEAEVVNDEHGPSQLTEVGHIYDQHVIGEVPPESTTTAVLGGSCWRMSPHDHTHGLQSSTIADRVCIDFVRNLSPTEGCWIGSSSKIMALILSEAIESPYMPSRPFRINAGPVHSYVCLADGITTKYLGELVAGDEIMIVDATTGKTRSVTVGRLKIETRPCVLVGLREGFEVDDGREHPSGQIFLQQAETVRLGSPGGTSVAVTDLETALYDEMEQHHPALLRISSTGTHLGGRVPGKVEER